MLCPRCDQQGEVKLVIIKRTRERVYLCNECDALWKEDSGITKSNFTDFSTYAAQFGLLGTWDEIETN